MLKIDLLRKTKLQNADENDVGKAIELRKKQDREFSETFANKDEIEKLQTNIAETTIFVHKQGPKNIWKSISPAYSKTFLQTFPNLA